MEHQIEKVLSERSYHSPFEVKTPLLKVLLPFELRTLWKLRTMACSSIRST